MSEDVKDLAMRAARNINASIVRPVLSAEQMAAIIQRVIEPAIVAAREDAAEWKESSDEFKTDGERKRAALIDSRAREAVLRADHEEGWRVRDNLIVYGSKEAMAALRDVAERDAGERGALQAARNADVKHLARALNHNAKLQAQVERLREVLCEVRPFIGFQRAEAGMLIRLDAALAATAVSSEYVPTVPKSREEKHGSDHCEHGIYVGSLCPACAPAPPSSDPATCRCNHADPKLCCADADDGVRCICPTSGPAAKSPPCPDCLAWRRGPEHVPGCPRYWPLSSGPAPDQLKAAIAEGVSSSKPVPEDVGGWLRGISEQAHAEPASGPAPRVEAPIPLNEEQEQAAKSWAADDRLWTTQGTVEFNLRTFARVI